MDPTKIDALCALDAAVFARERLCWVPAPWQETVLRSEKKRFILNAARQSGKSTVAAVLALWTALYHERALVLIYSPAERQSFELYAKLEAFALSLDQTMFDPKEHSKRSMKLANGSRILSLPGNPDTARSFSAPALVILDEASRIEVGLPAAVYPMLSSGGGRLMLLSTPNGKQGHFHQVWRDGDPELWEKAMVSIEEVEHADEEAVRGQMALMTQEMIRQEFYAEFIQPEHSLFRDEDIQSAWDADVPSFFTDKRRTDIPSFLEAAV